MAYSELIKHFQRIREYMHEFFIYGFRSRNTIKHKSQRSYDNEKRRLESYLKDYMSYQYHSSKTVFLSIDSRQIIHNPLYKPFYSKSFTAKDITLHFYILDILNDDVLLSFQEILNQIDHYLTYFDQPLTFDESTLRKKLNEYVQLGLLKTLKVGKTLYYQRISNIDLHQYSHALHYYSEVFPLGVIGSYILPQLQQASYFSFKHHYISRAIDSEIFANIFEAMHKKYSILLFYHNRPSLEVVPLRIYMSSQNSRCHLLAYSYAHHCIKTLRIDRIMNVKLSAYCEHFDKYKEKLTHIQKHIWSIQCYEKAPLEHVSFVIQIMPNESYILERLEREKRHGHVQKIDETLYQFSIDLYDSYEILPWLRTFIGRIRQLNFSNRTVENQLKEDLLKMYEIYHIKGDDSNDLS